MYFKNLVLSAFAVAMLAAISLSIYQEYFITPIILAAETYEVGTPDIIPIVWSPDDGAERTSFSLMANVLICFAYALILSSLMALKNVASVEKGLFWGGCAYLAVFVAPALGLPPEIPGMEAAQIEHRQAWWIMTVIGTIIGLWLLFFNTKIFKGLGLILLLIPHILGAPTAEIHGFANSNPEAIKTLTILWEEFILQTSIANALLWLIIGAGTGFLNRKFDSSFNTQGEINV